MLLKKIRVSELTKSASKTVSGQCRCWFALASGYDLEQPGGRRKNYIDSHITNKSGAEKQKKFCAEK